MPAGAWTPAVVCASLGSVPRGLSRLVSVVLWERTGARSEDHSLFSSVAREPIALKEGELGVP